MKRAAIRYAEILEKGAWVTHQEQAEIVKLLRSLVMTEDQAWDELEARLNRQKAIKQPQQEPVAWMYVNEDGECEQIEYGVSNVEAPYITLLYTAPPSKPEQDPVWCGCGDGIVANDEAKCGVCVMRLENQIERLKAQIEQSTPSKPWVSLTDDDRIEIFNSMDGGIYGFLKTWGWLNFSKELEAKLKEKNNGN